MKLNIRNTITALILSVSVFFIPSPAYAQSAADTIPPLIHAELAGDALHIEASDEGSGVDAVWVNGERVTYPDTAPLVLDAKTYAQSTDPVISVYAMDLAGNRSGVIDLENPFYQGTTSASASTDPEQVNPLTPNGQATVIDYADDGDGKEFFTFTTPDEHIFYLVIDRQRENDNVYFLNTVTESDLMALAEKNQETVSETETPLPEISVCTCTEKCVPGQVDMGCMVCKNNLESCLGKEPEEPAQENPSAKPSKSIGAGTLVFILLAAIAAGGAGYYLKIYKPKHDLDDAEDLDELLGDDEAEVNEDNEDETEGAEINEDESIQSNHHTADDTEIEEKNLTNLTKTGKEKDGDTTVKTDQEKDSDTTVKTGQGKVTENTTSYDDSLESDENTIDYDDYPGNDEPEKNPDDEFSAYPEDEPEQEEGE